MELDQIKAKLIFSSYYCFICESDFGTATDCIQEKIMPIYTVTFQM